MQPTTGLLQSQSPSCACMLVSTINGVLLSRRTGNCGLTIRLVFARIWQCTTRCLLCSTS